MNAWVQQGSSGYSYWYHHGETSADTAGRYELTIPASATVHLQVWKEGFAQPCAHEVPSVQRDLTLNVQLLAIDLLTTVPPAAPGTRNVSGVIYEMANGERAPVERAFVDYEPIMDFVAAFTFTGVDGRYSLCGLPVDRAVTIGVGLRGRVAYLTVPPGQTTADILLPR
ncbi:MAG TPA: hypothetical protein VJ717_10945 [Gemmatimonadaceae bacterium]|nr:hypothetical protein [Gemmatimonadaceae bacterium]